MLKGARNGEIDVASVICLVQFDRIEIMECKPDGTGVPEYAVKRPEAALKTFEVGFHIYQSLFKTNGPEIPFQEYEGPVIQAAKSTNQKYFSESGTSAESVLLSSLS